MRLGQWLQIGLFIVFLYAGMVLMLVFGDRNTVSQTENRALAVLPKWSEATLWSGKYFRSLESYTADHVAFREILVDASKSVLSWRGLSGKEGAILIASDANNSAESSDKSLSENKLPRTSPPITNESDPPLSKEEKGRVIGKVLIINNRAMNLFTYVPIAGKAYADIINKFYAESVIRFNDRIRISVLLAPTSIEFLRNASLKKMSSSQEAAIHAVYDQLNPVIAAIPALEKLLDHENEDLYFRTDHHWTATGAYYAYAAYMKAQGILPIPLKNYKTAEVKGFLGSLYSATLNKRLERDPDTILLYKPYVKHDYYVNYKGPIKMDLLDMAHSTKQNKYRIFLSGDRPWGQISTEINNGLRIAVIKDSFGNAMIPFLLPHYKEIFIIDPRQFDQQLLSFIEKHEINEVLFVNNIGVTSDSSFSELIKKVIQHGN
jgi:hypothetical protein